MRLEPLSSAEGRFRIDLPTKEPDVDANNNTKSFKWFFLNIGQFHVLYSDRDYELDTPEISQSIFDNLRNEFLAHGKLVGDSAITVSGHLGREFRVRTDGGGTRIDRIYLAGNRIYILSVFVPGGLSCKTGSAVRILDTFEIIEGTAMLTNNLSWAVR